MATDGAYTFALYDEHSNRLSEITYITDDKKGSYRLSRPSFWTGKVPCDQDEVRSVYDDGYPYLAKNRRLRVHRDGVLIHNGIVMNVSRIGDENSAFATFTSADPRVWWGSRTVRDALGNLAAPDYGTGISGPEILYQAIQASVAAEGHMALDLNGDYDGYNGPSGGVPDLSVAMSDFPKKLADLATMLVNTGAMDIDIDPIAADVDAYPDTVMGRLNAVTQQGDDRPDLNFDYGQGDNSISGITHVDSMETLCNKLYMYFGERESPERWRGLVTGDDLMPTQPDTVRERQYQLVQEITDSRARFGVWMDVQIYDTEGSSRLQTLQMYELLWQTEAMLRKNGRELVTFTPSTDCPWRPFVDYNLGDIPRLNVNADKFGVGYDNVGTRIYGFDIMPDVNGVERVGELVTSADAE